MINKILLVCLIATLAICIKAQPVAKSMIIGGGVSMYFDNEKVDEYDENNKTTQIRIQPMAGFFVSDRMAIGLEAGVSIANEKLEESSDERKRNETLFNIAPFLRYYLSSGTFGFFTEGSCNIGFGKLKITEGGNTTDGNITKVFVGISPGIYYYINPKIALEFSAGWIGYMYQSQEIYDLKQVMSRFGFDIETTGLSLGVTFTL